MVQDVKPLIRASIFAIMLFQVAALFARQYLMRELVEPGFDATLAKHLSYLVVPAILLVLMWPIIRKNKKPLRKLFRRPKSWPAMILASVALGLMLRLTWWASIFAAGSYGWLEIAAPGHGIDLSFYFACPPTSVLFLTIFVMSMLTPISEEIINRGLILNALSQKEPRIAVVLSALLFAILHSPPAIPAAFVFGIFAAVQLLRYRTLWAPIIAHSTYNFLQIIDWECWHGSWTPEEPTAGSIIGGIAITLAGLTCLVVAVRIVGHTRAGVD
jgi:membrane protease YdiL (CAAX protease family)